MRAPSSRTRRIVTLSAAPVAVLLAGAMVWQGSSAAFTAETRNVGNSWETGSMAISDDDGGAAMFQIVNVTPGQSGEKCIAVTGTSSVPSTVKMYTGDMASDGLEPYVMVKVEQGTGGGFSAGCGGFTAESTPNVEARQTWPRWVRTTPGRRPSCRGPWQPGRRPRPTGSAGTSTSRA